MKKKNMIRLLTVVTLVNSVVLLYTGVTSNAKNEGAQGIISGFLDKGSLVEMVVDRELKGEIISSYHDEEEASVVTTVEIESTLNRIGDLTTAEYTYSGVKLESDCNRFINCEIEFTRNQLEVEYDGVIRAGYNISDIDYEVDQENKVITFTLPEVQIFSNEITSQVVSWEDNVFNRVDPDETSRLIDEARADELETAIENGIYLEAEESAREIIADAFKTICDYEVQFSELSLISQDSM